MDEGRRAAAKLAAEEAELKKFAGEVAALKVQVDDAGRPASRQQLAELETAIVEAETIIPEDVRDRYRRTVKQHGSEAMAPVEFDRKSQIGFLFGLFRLGDDPGPQRADQRPHMTLLQDLRPRPLSSRGERPLHPQWEVRGFGPRGDDGRCRFSTEVRGRGRFGL